MIASNYNFIIFWVAVLKWEFVIYLIDMPKISGLCCLKCVNQLWPIGRNFNDADVIWGAKNTCSQHISSAISSINLGETKSPVVVRRVIHHMSIISSAFDKFWTGFRAWVCKILFATWCSMVEQGTLKARAAFEMLEYWFEWYASRASWTRKSFDLDWLRIEGLMAVMQTLTVESGWKSGSAGGMAR